MKFLKKLFSKFFDPTQPKRIGKISTQPNPRVNSTHEQLWYIHVYIYIYIYIYIFIRVRRWIFPIQFNPPTDGPNPNHRKFLNLNPTQPIGIKLFMIVGIKQLTIDAKWQSIRTDKGNCSQKYKQTSSKMFKLLIETLILNSKVIKYWNLERYKRSTCIIVFNFIIFYEKKLLSKFLCSFSPTQLNPTH